MREAQAFLSYNKSNNIYTRKDILHTDIANAYQTISRQEVINQKISKTSPDLAQHFLNRFNNKSSVNFIFNDQNTSIRHQEYPKVVRLAVQLLVMVLIHTTKHFKNYY